MELPRQMEIVFEGLQCELGIDLWAYTGSRAICPESITADSDYDLICICDHYPDTKNQSQGYTGKTDFISLKWTTPDGILNLLLTESRGFFQQFCNATRLARHLKLAAKKDRVMLFQAVLYENFP